MKEAHRFTNVSRPKVEVTVTTFKVDNHFTVEVRRNGTKRDQHAKLTEAQAAIQHNQFVSAARSGDYDKR